MMRWFERWRLLGISCAAILLASLAIAAANAFDEASVRAAIRLTARTSLLFFLLAFTASAIHKLWPSALSSWQRRNRRQFGLAFAFSHLVHAILIATLANMGPEQAADALTTQMLVFGGLGYVVIAAMAATSFDRAVLILGPRNWRLLHVIGGHYLWFQFLISFGKRVPVAPGYLVFIAILAAAMGARIAAMRASRPASATLRTI